MTILPTVNIVHNTRRRLFSGNCMSTFVTVDGKTKNINVVSVKGAGGSLGGR